MRNNLFEVVKKIYYVREYLDYNELPAHFYNPTNTYDDPTDSDVSYLFDLQDVQPVEDLESTYQYSKKWTLKNNWPSVNVPISQLHTTEEKYLDCYQKINFDTNFYRHICCISEKDDKISFKFFSYDRTRKKGVKYFKIFTSCRFVTYSKKSNSLYFGSIVNYHKKRKFSKVCKRASISSSPLRDFIYQIKSNFDENIANEATKIFINSITQNYNPNINCDEQLMEYILKRNGVKLSNNWVTLRQNYLQPKLKDFRSNDFKYVDSFMKVNKLKGDKIRKVLHLLNNDCSVQGFLNLNKFLGEKFVLSRPEDELKLFFRMEAEYFTFSFTNFSKQEMGRIYKIILLVLERKVSCNTFNDHVDFYRFLEKYETMKWKSESYEDFNDEHIRWTEKYQFYTTGIYERTYSQDFENFLIKPLILDEETFFPVLLKTSSEYNMESTIQSNCVKTYVNKAENFIVSLRKKSKGSTERATVEYLIVSNDGKLYPKRVQSLGRFNKRLDVEFEAILNILDVRVKELFQEKLYTLPTIKVTKGHTTTLSKAIVKRTLLNGYTIDWDSSEVLDTTNLYHILNDNNQNDDVEIPELF